jgi:ABC-type glycerol-3-phosphate transport system substrate-binding protein
LYALDACLRANGDALVDWNSEGSGFNRDLFIKVLHFANQFPPDEFFTYDIDIVGRIRDSGQTTLLPDRIEHILYYQYSRALFGGPVVYPGYPSEDRKGNLIVSDMLIAINDKCRDKAAAWEFISGMLDEKFQIEQSRSPLGGFPILKDAFDLLAAEAMEATYTTDDNGIRTEVSKGVEGITADFTVELFAATAEEIQAVRNLIESAEKIAIYDAQIMEIVREEAQTFFAGIVSAEQAADVAENRIRTYVNEMK